MFFKEKNYILVLLDKVGQNINGKFHFFNKVKEINIILKYDPITDDEIKYVMTTGFIDYLNKTVIIT